MANIRQFRKKTHTAINNFFRRVPIFPRLFCVMLLLTVVPTTLVTLISFHSYVTEIKENTEHFISLLVGNISVQVKERQETYERSARAFYSDGEMMDLLEQNAQLALESGFQTNSTYLQNKHLVERRLFDMTESSKYVLNFQFITDYDQYCMRNSNNEQRGCVLHDLQGFLHSSYYQKTLYEKGYPCWFDTTQVDDLIYKYDYSTSGTLDTLTMTVAVYSPQSRELLGILMYNLDRRFLTQSLTNYAFYGTGNTFLVGRDSVIGTLNPNLKAPLLSDESSIQTRVLAGSSGSFTLEDDGRNLFVSFQKSAKMDLYVVHIVNMDTLLEPAYSIRNKCLFLVFLVLLLCIILARCTARSISDPLRSLVGSMERFGRNEFQERCTVDGRDELTVVSSGFNQMAEDTERMVDEIVTANLRQKTLELSKATAELNALQMQIRPHFLYNTLDLIRWEMIRIVGDESSASRMLDSFCQLMRMSIKKGEELVSVASELEHAQVYLDVVNFRNTEKIQLLTSIEFDTDAFLIPKLTLQPLIENTVIHGFKKHIRPPVVHIRGWRIKNMLMITITDNGRGMPSDELETLRRNLSAGEVLEERSIGLRNVNQRFKLRYGDSYGVSVESVQDLGTEITLRLPLSEQGKKEDCI